MAVFTPLEPAALERFLQDYNCGELRQFDGITSGTENTNYFVSTGSGEYVLTLFESLDAGTAAFCLGLTRHLHAHGGRCAAPVTRRDGTLLGTLEDKPAALVTRLPGASVTTPTSTHCRAIGSAMAQLHLAGASYRTAATPPDDRERVQTLVTALGGVLAPADRSLAARAGHDLAVSCPALPGGIIHGDLFRDNALYVDQHLSGVIDFYYAHEAPYVYDLAVTVADWCYMPDLAFNADHARALLDAYAAVRPVQDTEAQAWVSAMALAAARFWLSRLHDQHLRPPGILHEPKDPAPFRQLLTYCLDEPAALPALR